MHKTGSLIKSAPKWNRPVQRKPREKVNFSGK